MRNTSLSLISILMMFCLAFTTMSAHAAKKEPNKYEQQGWKIKRDHKRSNTQVYLKDMQDSKIKTFLAVSEVNYDIPTLLMVMNDMDSMPKWVHKMKSIDLIERKSPLDLHQYVVYTTPPPAKDRDMYLHTTAKRDAKTGIVTITSEMLEGYRPEKPGLVRMDKGFNTFRLIPLEEKKTRIEFSWHGDPGGFIPAWAVNMVLHTTPYYTMKKLIRQAKSSRYKDSLPYLQTMWEETYGEGAFERDYPEGVWRPEFRQAQIAQGD